MYKIGDKVVGCLAKSGKLFEGNVYEAMDGNLYILNETTGRWCFLNELNTKINLREEELDVSQIKSFNDFVKYNVNKMSTDGADFKKIQKNDVSNLARNIKTLAKDKLNLQDTPMSDNEAEKAVADEITAKTAENEAGEAQNQAAVDQAEKEISEIQKRIGESEDRLTNIRLDYLKEQNLQRTYTALQEFGMSDILIEKTLNRWDGYLHESHIDYTNDFVSLSPENFNLAVAVAYARQRLYSETIVNSLEDLFEISHEDAMKISSIAANQLSKDEDNELKPVTKAKDYFKAVRDATPAEMISKLKDMFDLDNKTLDALF